MNQRQIAITTGVSLILMAGFAGFSIGYAYPEFYQVEHLDLLKEKIVGNQGLYINMLFGILLILILDLVVSYYLYKYFEKDSRKIATLSATFRVMYTVIFAIAAYYLVKNLTTDELTNQIINSNYEQFQTIWNLGLVLFGFHIVLIGWLMRLHQRIPKLLWYLTLFAGICYIILHLLKVTASDSTFVTTLEMILALPMAAGELGLAIWLLIKGGKGPKNTNLRPA